MDKGRFSPNRNVPNFQGSNAFKPSHFIPSRAITESSEKTRLRDDSLNANKIISTLVKANKNKLKLVTPTENHNCRKNVFAKRY